MTHRSLPDHGYSKWRTLIVMLLAMVLAQPNLAGEPPRKTTTRRATSAAEILVVTCRADQAGQLREALDARGAKVVAHLGPHRWLVVGAARALDGIAALKSTHSWQPSQGIVPALRVVVERQALQPSNAPVNLVVALANGDEVNDLDVRLESAGAAVTWIARDAAPVPQLGVRVSGSLLRGVVEILEATQGLVWTDLQPPVRLLNADSVWRCQSGEDGSTPVFDRGLRGEGQIIGIMDTGLDVDDCRFNDEDAGLPALNTAVGTDVNPDHRKVLAVDFHWDLDWPPQVGDWDDEGHGTHVAGSAAGDVGGNQVHDEVDGMAPAARLVIQDGGAWRDDCADLPGLGCPVKPLGPVLEQARNQGARIHTNSWGDEENFLPYSRYTERTADVDRFMWLHKDTLVVFAAGNSGPQDDSIGSPATGKNVVAVGATIHGELEPTCPVSFSSRGWTHDGRIKPDVVAPGVRIVSAATNFVVPRPSCNDVSSSGTSMAAPTAAGLGALIRQYFTDGFYPTGLAREGDGFEPTAALVKAVLIASGVDLASLGCPHEPIPSRDQGWGLVQLDTALAFSGDRHRLLIDDHRDGFRAPGEDPVDLEVVLTATGPLKVVLVWTDAPSSSLAEINLVNDLDLGVHGPGGRFLGNNFTDGVSIHEGQADRLNNVEVVYLPEAEKGTWIIEVAPHVIPAPAQDYALVVVGQVRRVEGPRRASGRVSP